MFSKELIQEAQREFWKVSPNESNDTTQPHSMEC